MIIRLFFISIFCSLPFHPYAQFVDMEITVTPELSASVQQELNFGNVFINSGQTRVGLGDVDMGVFTITGLKNKSILVNLDVPDNLIHQNTSINSAIPLNIEAAYNNRCENDYRNAIYMERLEARLAICGLRSRDNTQNTVLNWGTVYVYIFGSIQVGNIEEGLYQGNIVLNVEYE